MEGGSFFTQLQIENPCSSCPLAYAVYTSSPINYKIAPACGFVPALHSQPVRIIWEAVDHPRVAGNPTIAVDKLENTMFFIKGLPLDPAMDVSMTSGNAFKLEKMKQNLTEVFNTYNLGILFRTHHLPCRLQQQAFNPQ